MSSIFQIRELSCVYEKKDTLKLALKIEELDIPRGKIIMCLGKSGIGKSTILEALGLMNQTIKAKENSRVDFFPYKNNSNYLPFAEMWNKSEKDKTNWISNHIKKWYDPKEKTVAGIRNTHFSFIFQNTNLMPNFSVGENIYLTQLLQEKSEEKAIVDTVNMLDDIGLQDMMNEKIYELSGGQRQRVAFARSLLPKYTVLFGDEPTGNLDPITSKKLMDIIYKDINLETENHPPNKTCIIATHNIDLALNYADYIIVFTESSPNNAANKARNIHGELLKEMVFKSQYHGDKSNNRHKKSWENCSEELLSSTMLEKIIKEAMFVNSNGIKRFLLEKKYKDVKNK